MEWVNDWWALDSLCNTISMGCLFYNRFAVTPQFKKVIKPVSVVESFQIEASAEKMKQEVPFQF